jgi:hypothetical protein
LIPFALLAGGHWRTLIAAAVTSAALIAATLLLFGAQMWADFFEVMPSIRGTLDLGLVSTYKMQSVYAALRLLDVPTAIAYGAQTFTALGSVIFVVLTWRQPVDQGLKNAALVTASFLATPFVLDYDLMLVAPAIAWLTAYEEKNGALPWERITLALACLDPLIARSIGKYAHIGLTPAIIAGLLVLVSRKSASVRDALALRDRTPPQGA